MRPLSIIVEGMQRPCSALSQVDSDEHKDEREHECEHEHEEEAEDIHEHECEHEYEDEDDECTASAGTTFGIR